MGKINDETVTLLPDEPTTAFLAAHSAVDQRLLAAPYNLIRTEREAPTCSLALLPFLAWERSVHHYTGTDEALDRARTASSFEDHAAYGCPPAYEDELKIDLAWPDVRIREWWEVKGFEWPDFEVVIGVEPGGPAPPPFAAVYAASIARKNVRDWPQAISYEVEETAPLAIGAVATLNATINLLPFDPPSQNVAGVYVGAAITVTATLNLRPF